MPYDHQHTMWQFSFPISEESAKLLSGDGQSLKEEALRQCSDWHNPLVQLILSTDPSLISGHPAYDRNPLSYDVLRKFLDENSKITLLGDAGHPMSPFKGQGANQALVDALSLAKYLSTSDLMTNSLYSKKQPISMSLRQYESEMLERSSAKVVKSREAAYYLHSEHSLVKGDITRAMAAELYSVN